MRVRVREPTDRQLGLFYFFQEHYESGLSFTLDEAAEFAGYKSGVSLLTVVGAHFLDVWVFAVDSQHYVVRDFGGVSIRAFTDAMCQVTRLSFEDERTWRKQVSKLLALGMQQGFPILEAVLAIVDELTAPGNASHPPMTGTVAQAPGVKP